MPSKPKSKTVETDVSRAQGKILLEREELYKKYFFPEVLNQMQQTQGTGMAPMLAQQSLANIGQAHQSARQELGRSLSQRGITGGLQQAAFSGLEQARSSSTASALNQATLQNQQLRQGLLSMGLEASPKPTQAVLLGQKSG